MENGGFSLLSCLNGKLLLPGNLTQSIPIEKTNQRTGQIEALKMGKTFLGGNKR
jgi:hypothetical protein